jgi:hypothetical protein
VSASSRCDPLGEAGECLGEVVLEPHLALEVGADRLNDEPDAGLGDIGRRSVAEAVLLGRDELDPDELDVRSNSRPQRPLSANRVLSG